MGHYAERAVISAWSLVWYYVDKYIPSWQAVAVGFVFSY